MSDYLYQSATSLAELIRTGQATASEVVSQHLDQIASHNSQLNAVAILLEEEALSTVAGLESAEELDHAKKEEQGKKENH